MRKLIELLTIFDWVTPSVGLVEDLLNDPTPLQSNSWTFFIPYDDALSAGWNAVGIEGMLAKFGIKTWGSQISNGAFFFSVKLDQARWAEHLLSRHGVPLQERSLGSPRPKGRRNNSSAKNNVGLGDDLLSFLDDLL